MLHHTVLKPFITLKFTAKPLSVGTGGSLRLSGNDKCSAWKHKFKTQFKMDFAQSSSNKCKKHLVQIYSQHSNLMNTI